MGLQANALTIQPSCQILRRAKELSLHYLVIDSLSRRAQQTIICLPSSCFYYVRVELTQVVIFIHSYSHHFKFYRLIKSVLLQIGLFLDIKKASRYRRCFVYIVLLLLAQHRIHVFLRIVQIPP